MGADDRGPERRGRAQGRKADRLQAALGELDPTLARWADDHIFGDVWAEDALGFDDRMLVAITALATLGRRNQLRNYLHGALQSGRTPEELREVMKMLTVYAGFPVAIEAMLELDAAVKASGAGS
ncbi:carboxymuconolactone decarboxylase family protein [Nocardioides caldifontis]|uniref:carboxymuconolactone decarboxylase family protein n=1 Tax=Nocardioides caldifontis TaxID=2588938 RepID=UPI0011DFADD2|nr:carboxymuconolactone decarboxylase family protein [Nocardioides caldifontis]